MHIFCLFVRHTYRQLGSAKFAKRKDSCTASVVEAVTDTNINFH